MGVFEVGWPTCIAIIERVAVERFAMLVSDVGVGLGHLQVADTAVLLVTMVLHNKLAIVGDNFAVIGIRVMLPDFCWSNLDANSRWQVWIIKGGTFQGCWCRSFNRKGASRLFIVNEFRCKLPNELAGISLDRVQAL